MKMKVLGCSGAEFPGNNSTGFLLDDKILFDAGSLTNVLDEKAQLKIKYIFLTHAHFDHIKSIPFLADNIILKNRNHRLQVMSILSVLKTIKRNLLNNSMWPDFTAIPDTKDAVLTLIPLKVEKLMERDGYKIIPYKVNHSVPAVGYLVEGANKKRFFYTGDTGPTDETWEKIEKYIHCLIIEVSLPNRMEGLATKTGHLTPSLLKEELQKIKYMPERVYITHLKPQYYNIIKTELERLKIKNLQLLKEGEIINI